MGWTFNTRPQSKQQIVQELLGGGCLPAETEVVKHSLRGNNLWILLDWKPENKKIIWLFRLEKDRANCWGWKGMVESEGPYYFDCPVSWFKLAPEPDGFNRDIGGQTWRELCRERR